MCSANNPIQNTMTPLALRLSYTMPTYMLFVYFCDLLSYCLVCDLIERFRMPYPATPRDDLFTAFLDSYFHSIVVSSIQALLSL